MSFVCAGYDGCRNKMNQTGTISMLQITPNTPVEYCHFSQGGSFGVHDGKVCLVLNRQCMSTSLNVAHPLFFIEFNKSVQEISKPWGFLLCFSGDKNAWGVNKNGQRVPGNRNHERETFSTLEKAQIVAQARIKEIFAVDAYFYKYPVIGSPGVHNSYSYQSQDKYFTPVIYDDANDTIKHIESDVCIISFNNKESFNPEDIQINKEDVARQYWPLVEKAIKNVHESDVKKGFESVKQYITWLLGEYIKDKHVLEKVIVTSSLVNSEVIACKTI